MIRVLSTKKLTPDQRNILNSDVFELTDYDAIIIQEKEFKIPVGFQHLIFTSQNAVKAFFGSYKASDEIPQYSCYCVGEKTKSLLEDFGQKVIKNSKNASELGNFLIKNAKNHHFLYLRGNISRPELPSILLNGEVNFTELEIYETILNPLKFDKDFKAVLFFSPSGVSSYTAKNLIGESKAFCIGNTTAEMATNFTEKLIVAERTTTEDLLHTVKLYYQSSIAK